VPSFPRTPFSATGALPPLRSGQVFLDEAEHFLHNRSASVATLRDLFAFGPECRSRSLRNQRSPSPESASSPNSSQVSAKPIAPPAAPTGLTATSGNAQVTLNWAGKARATSYNVKRATVSGGPYTTVASVTTTSYTDTGLTNGTTYYYVVSAVDAGGESPNSTQVSVTPK